VWEINNEINTLKLSHIENKELGLIAYLRSHVEYFSPNFNLIK